MPTEQSFLTRTLRSLSRWGRSSSGDDSLRVTAAREGQVVGHYQIQRHLGSGGMGDVYLALDLRLGRQVALKFLPPHLTADGALAHRFAQEARTASALNHPNILTIYDAGDHEGEFYIASEYIDGVTLRAMMAGEHIDQLRAIDIAMQIASALSASHAAGIVHRDLKPHNVMLRRDGYVKIIDFGLAKLTEAFHKGGNEHRTHDDWTRPGTIIGTVAYMSPEQARGLGMDHRTDLWSLGVILYEMLAQSRPFDGETDSHVLVAILDQPARRFESPLMASSRLVSIIDRALEKERHRRYQSADEFLRDLEAAARTAQDLSNTVTRQPFIPRPPRQPRGLLLIGAALVLLVLGVAAVFGWRWWHTDLFVIGGTRQLTFTGTVKFASASPDGRYLAFTTIESDKTETMYLRLVDGGMEEVKIPRRKIHYLGLAFASDNLSIFAVWEDGNDTGHLFKVPVFGAPPQFPLLEDIDGAPSFSPDGSRLAFIRYHPNGQNAPPETSIEIADVDGTNDHSLITVPARWTVGKYASWSPDGKEIACFLTGPAQGRRSALLLDRIDLQGHERRQVLGGWHFAGQPWWSRDAKSVIASMAAPNEGNEQPQLRQVILRTGEVRDIRQDTEGVTILSMTKDRDSLVAVKREPRTRLWVSANGRFDSGTSSSSDVDQSPTVNWFDADHLLTHSRRGGAVNLWSVGIDGSSRSSLTSGRFVDHEASPVPGRPDVVFSSNRLGGSHIWRLTPLTNRLQQLTSGETFDETPDCAPDGKWVLFTSWRSNHCSLQRVPLDGGDAVAAIPFAARHGLISPDGHSILCELQEQVDAPWTTAIIHLDHPREPIRLRAISWPYRWSQDGKSVLYVAADAQGVGNLWMQPLNTRPKKQLTHFTEDAILAFAFAPQGRRVACLRGFVGGDVILYSRAAGGVTDWH